MTEPPSFPFRCDFVNATKQLLDRNKGIADEVLERASQEKFDAITSRNSSAILVQKGKEDIQNNEFLLFSALDGLDGPLKERICSALYFVLCGVENISANGVIPASAFHIIDEADAAIMRQRRSIATSERNKIIENAVAGHGDKSDAFLARIANPRREKNGYRPLSAKQIGRVAREIFLKDDQKKSDSL